MPILFLPSHATVGALLKEAGRVMSNLGTKTVLLLEDTALAAWEIEDELREAGYDVAGSFSSCAKAEQWLETTVRMQLSLT
jgi:hypothetical protein